MLTNELVVTALYRALLGREPDEHGLATYSSALAKDPSSLTEVIERFVRSDEFKAQGLAGDSPAVRRESQRLTNDFTQYGEFEILLKLWVNAAAKHRIVVDVGARGRDRSNSYDLLKSFNWRGLLIEANPALIESIRREFSGLDMLLIHCAASDYDGTAEFHLGVNDDVSSLNSEAAAAWGAISGKTTVPVKRLGPLLTEHGIPKDFDLLSLDIEGEDIKVLNDLIRGAYYRPRWIIIEASNDFQTKSLYDLPFSDEVRALYAIVGQTVANLVLELKDA